MRMPVAISANKVHNDNLRSGDNAVECSAFERFEGNLVDCKRTARSRKSAVRNMATSEAKKPHWSPKNAELIRRLVIARKKGFRLRLARPEQYQVGALFGLHIRL